MRHWLDLVRYADGPTLDVTRPVIMVFLPGGPCHINIWDMKPDSNVSIDSREDDLTHPHQDRFYLEGYSGRQNRSAPFVGRILDWYKTEQSERAVCVS